MSHLHLRCYVCDNVANASDKTGQPICKDCKAISDKKKDHKIDNRDNGDPYNIDMGVGKNGYEIKDKNDIF